MYARQVDSQLATITAESKKDRERESIDNRSKDIACTSKHNIIMEINDRVQHMCLK